MGETQHLKTPVEAPAAGRPWWHLSPLVLSLALESSELGLLAVMFPAIGAALGLAIGEFGVLTAAGKVAGVIAAPVWIVLSGRMSRKGMLVWAAGLSGVVTMAMGRADGFVMLFVLSCALAAIYSGVAPLTTAILADLFEDRSRGRAVGVLYASITLFGGVTGAVLGQLAGVEDGWRLAYLLLGGMGTLAALLIVFGFRDPGVGAAEGASAGPQPGLPQGWGAALSVFRVPSFNLMLLSRLLSGHLVIGSFGILFLTGMRGMPNATAALVLAPLGAGLCIGSVAGAAAGDWLHGKLPGTGRVLLLQVAQFAFAAAACLATQVPWEGLGVYLGLWGVLGFLQGVNPGVNRPIVISVIRPALRSWAFIVMLAIVEPAGWAAYSYGVSRFGDGEGLRQALLVALVGFMVLNGLAITPLYWTYRRDAARAAAPSGPAQ